MLLSFNSKCILEQVYLTYSEDENPEGKIKKPSIPRTGNPQNNINQ